MDNMYSVGSMLLIFGCIRQEFKKSALNVVSEILGFVLMMVAYIPF